MRCETPNVGKSLGSEEYLSVFLIYTDIDAIISYIVMIIYSNID